MKETPTLGQPGTLLLGMAVGAIGTLVWVAILLKMAGAFG